MPVLILDIASFLAFVAILVLLLIADTVESLTIRRKRSLTPAAPMALLSIRFFGKLRLLLWS